MTIYNKTNERFEEIKRNASGDMDAIFIDDIVTVKYGGYVIGFEWDYVDRVLDCFEDTEDFDIREIDGAFFVQGVCGKAQKRKFEAACRGDLEEAEA